MNTNATLTRRESQITELIAWGATYKDVSNLLSISPRTVENTVRSAKEKTGVTKVNELSAWYFCTHFNISFNLSPLQRSIIALVFLMLWLPYEFTTHPDVLTTVRSRRIECREKDIRRTEDMQSDYLLDI